MTHDSYREWIQRELDDDLSSEELALLEAHVATCANCRREREEFAELADGLSRLSHLMPERSLVPLITPNILPEKQKQAARRISPLWWRGLSVAAVVVLAIGWSTQWKFGQSAHLAGHRQTPAAPEQVALLPSSPPGQGQSATSGQQTATTVPSTIGATDSQAGTRQDAPHVLENVTTLLKQSLFGMPAGQGSSSSATATHPSHPTLLADASTGLTTQPTVTGSTHPVIPAPAATDKGSGTGNGTDSNAASGKTGTVTGTGTTDTNTKTDPVPTPSPVPTPTPVVKPTPSNGGGYRPSVTGGQSTVPTDDSNGSIQSIGETFSQSLQQQVDNGVAAAQWATDPVQAVQHSLPALGFSGDAAVTATSSPDLVHVLQGGVQFEITLVQPYKHGDHGIWEPQQIGRAINEAHPSSYEKPIIDYFKMIKDTGMIAAHQPIYVLRTSAPGRIVVTVVEQHVDKNGVSQWVKVKYLFHLKKTTDLNWELNGNPMKV